jgi:hypothetical protein
MHHHLHTHMAWRLPRPLPKLAKPNLPPATPKTRLLNSPALLNRKGARTKSGAPQRLASSVSTGKLSARSQPALGGASSSPVGGGRGEGQGGAAAAQSGLASLAPALVCVLLNSGPAQRPPSLSLIDPG